MERRPENDINLVAHPPPCSPTLESVGDRFSILEASGPLSSREATVIE